MTPAFSAALLAARLEALLAARSRAHPWQLCVAFSAGADSTALLASLAELRPGLKLKLRALHVDHQLLPESSSWARVALATARKLRVPCQVLRIRVPLARGESPEAVARQARYAALGAELRPGEWLVTAHHQQDQAETVLLQLLRGAGAAGLAAMPATGAFGAFPVLRPLLGVSRAQLSDYLTRRKLSWVADPSNDDARFDRNYLRAEVLPVLRKRWPSVERSLARSATLAAEARELLEQRAASDYRQVGVAAALSVPLLRRLPLPARRNLLRYWLRRLAAPLPDQRRLQEMATSLLAARAAAQPVVQWAGVAVVRYDQRLHLLVVPLPAPFAARRWRPARQARVTLAGAGRLQLLRSPRGNLDLARLPRLLTVRCRRGGEVLQESFGTQPLKQWLQQRRVPPWQRGRLPLVYSGQRLLAVADLWLHPALRATAASGRARARLRFEPQFD